MTKDLQERKTICNFADEAQEYNEVILLLIIFGSLAICATIAIMKRNARNDKLLAHDFSWQNTLPIRGLLAVLIIFHHTSLMTEGASVPQWFLEFRPWGNFIVAIFFFISGYGLTISFLKKCSAYIDSFLSHRFAKLLPAFVVATVAYLTLVSWQTHTNEFASIWKLCTGRYLPLPDSWFIYTLILYYLLFYLCAHYFKTPLKTICVLWGASLLYSFTLKLLAWPNWWYQSAFALNIGMTYAYYEPAIKERLSGSPRSILISLWSCFLAISAMAIIYLYILDNPYSILGMCCVIPLLVVVYVLVLGSFHSTTLDFLGTFSYEIYLVQGAMKMELSFMDDAWVPYLAAVLTTSLICGWLLHKITNIQNRHSKTSHAHQNL